MDDDEGWGGRGDFFCRCHDSNNMLHIKDR